MNTPEREMREGETIEGSRTMRNRPYPVLKCSRESVRTTVGIASSTNKLPLYHSTTTRTPKPFPSQRLTTPSATARRTRTITRTGTSSSTGTDDTNRPRAPVGRLLAFEAWSPDTVIVMVLWLSGHSSP